MNRPTILIIGTNMMNIYNHRLELINRLISLNMNVSVVAPRGGEEQELQRIGVKFIDTPVDNRGTNIIHDVRLLCNLIAILRREKPDVVLTFYTKTNIYGGLACRITATPYIENITGLGSALSGKGLLQQVMIKLYHQAVKAARMVFFQNKPNQKFFEESNITVKKSRLLPGSGVSLDRFKPLEYPTTSDVTFIFISRILKEKGIEEFVEAAKIILQKYPNTKFQVIGPANEEYIDYLNSAQKQGIIQYYGKQFDIKPFIRQSHCTVFPSYYAEGMANVLLESAACARPIITTALPGCGETVDDNVSGYIVKERDAIDLAAKLKKFILLSNNEKKMMGIMGRKKMEKEFDREIVISAYVTEISAILISNKNNY